VTPGPVHPELFLVKLVAAAVAVLVAIEVVQKVGLPTVWSSLLVLGLGLLTLWVILRSWAAVGAPNLEELEHGYTTLVLEYGHFRPTGDRRWGATVWHVPWDYSGLWVLGGDGRVLSPPDPETEPPGFYPSPNRPGEYELWTGTAWAGQFRSWERPGLPGPTVSARARPAAAGPRRAPARRTPRRAAPARRTPRTPAAATPGRLAGGAHRATGPRAR
jgi:hypothetical protein